MSDKYDEMAMDVECSYPGGEYYDGDEARKAIAAALRESAAQAYEDAAMVVDDSGMYEEDSEIKDILKAKSAALRAVGHEGK